MIRFDGALTGEAEKRFFQKQRGCEQVILLSATAVAAALWLLCTYQTALFSLMVELLIGGFAVVFLATLIPKGQKEKKRLMPQSVTLADGYITAVCATKKKRCPIADVKEVQDCKTYYELVLPLSHFGFVCICQKDRLLQGSLAEFEELFEGKITDMTGYFD